MKIVYLSFLLLLINLVASAAPFIVKDGEAHAEIVLSDDAPRSTRFAARDLQVYLEKISGAKLTVVSKPSGKGLVKLFVGESEGTRALKLSIKGLEHGAYRLVSGSDWLAFLGDDTDFVPTEPWAKRNTDRVTGKYQREWEKVSGTRFGVPNGGMYKNRERMPAELAREPDECYWNYDERGSFNAVCGFLNKLGVRWYLPGELGEVVPQRKTIALPKLNMVVKPDFPLRQFSVRFGTASDPTTMYQPSTSTKNMILKGRAIIMGGSIIMPMDISTEATTMSMMRKGMKTRKPISNARRSSLIMNDGIKIRSGICLRISVSEVPERSANRTKSFSRT